MVSMLTSEYRTTQFVTEEWATWFANGVASAVVGGWKGSEYSFQAFNFHLSIYSSSFTSKPSDA